MSYTPKYLIENKNNYPNEPALSVKINNVWSTLTWSEYHAYVLKISKSMSIDFFPKGPSMFKILPAKTTLTLSGIEIFIFPIFDIVKIPYKLFHHQLYVF